MKAQHVFFALFGSLALVGYFLTWGEWKEPLPPGMGPSDGWRRTTLPATHAIDLGSGAVQAATLQYSANGFGLSDGEGELVPGFGFAVRTSEGNFAKVRVVEVGANRSLTPDWQMLGPATGARVTAENPSLESRRLTDGTAPLL